MEKQEEGEIIEQQEDQSVINNSKRSHSRDKKKQKKDKKRKKSSRSRSKSNRNRKGSKNTHSPQRRSRSHNRKSKGNESGTNYRGRSSSSRSQQKKRRSSRSRSESYRRKSRSQTRKSKKEKKEKKDRDNRDHSRHKEKKQKKDKKDKRNNEKNGSEVEKHKFDLFKGAFAEDNAKLNQEEEDFHLDEEKTLEDFNKEKNEQEQDKQRAALLAQIQMAEPQKILSEEEEQEEMQENKENDDEEISDSEQVVINKIDNQRLEMLKRLQQQREANSRKNSRVDDEEEEDEQNEDDEEDDKEEVDEFDMFNIINQDINQMNGQDNTTILGKGQEHDDAENYLKIILGQMIGDRYKITKKLGKGVFANVCSAEDIQASDPIQKNVAIKVLRNEEIMLYSGEKELKILNTLNQADKFNKRHIVRLLRHFDYHGHLCLVFELLEMNLRDTIKHYGKMQLDHVKSYGIQLFKALTHIKKCKIVHADLKPDNILITQDTKMVKICDFGTSYPIEETMIVQELVSPFYRAPEIIIGYPFDYSIDTWSIACTLYEMFTGQFLFTGRNNNEILKNQLSKRGKLKPRMLKKAQFVEQFFDSNQNFLSQEFDPVTKKDYVKPINFGDIPIIEILPVPKNIFGEELKKYKNFKDLIEKCTNMDPKQRLTPEKALEHPFFQIGPLKK